MRSMKMMVTLLALLVVTIPAAAQRYVWVGAAATQPLGDTKEGLKSGYLAEFGFGTPFNGSQNVSVQAAGYYGSNDLKGVSSSVDLLGASVGLGYTLMQARLSPYLLANVGVLRSDDGGNTQTDFLYQAGVGVTHALGTGSMLFTEVRYLSTTGRNKIEMMPIAFGVVFLLGGN